MKGDGVDNCICKYICATFLLGVGLNKTTINKTKRKHLLHPLELVSFFFLLGVSIKIWLSTKVSTFSAAMIFVIFYHLHGCVHGKKLHRQGKFSCLEGLYERKKEIDRLH